MSRGTLTLDAFLTSHGFHGPAEGEVSSRSWREDPSPLKTLIETYRAMDDSSGPKAVEQQQMQERGTAVAELLGALPWFRRGGAKVVLGAAKRYVPQREVGKTAFLQALDVARSSARVLGAAPASSRAAPASSSTPPSHSSRGEILVCETAEPSWTSLLVSAGLVIDIGGPISHGAIVARELVVPCVINTRIGTGRLQTGDLLRVDGSAGVVEVLQRA